MNKIIGISSLVVLILLSGCVKDRINAGDYGLCVVYGERSGYRNEEYFEEPVTHIFEDTTVGVKRRLLNHDYYWFSFVEDGEEKNYGFSDSYVEITCYTNNEYLNEKDKAVYEVLSAYNGYVLEKTNHFSVITDDPEYRILLTGHPQYIESCKMVEDSDGNLEEECTQSVVGGSDYITHTDIEYANVSYRFLIYEDILSFREGIEEIPQEILYELFSASNDDFYVYKMS